VLAILDGLTLGNFNARRCDVGESLSCGRVATVADVERLRRPVARRVHEAPDGPARNAEIAPPSQGSPSIRNNLANLSDCIRIT
jgi:hypothetical protein